MSDVSKCKQPREWRAYWGKSAGGKKCLTEDEAVHAVKTWLNAGYRDAFYHELLILRTVKGTEIKSGN